MERAFLCSQTERWSEMAPLVPDMIADAWELAHTADTDAQRRTAHELAALVLEPVPELILPGVS